MALWTYWILSNYVKPGATLQPGESENPARREHLSRRPRTNLHREAMLRRCVILIIATLVSNGLSLQIPAAGPPRGEASHSHLQQQQRSQQSAEKRQQQTPELLQAAREAEEKERISLLDVCADLKPSPVDSPPAPLTHLTNLLRRGRWPRARQWAAHSASSSTQLPSTPPY